MTHSMVEMFLNFFHEWIQRDDGDLGDMLFTSPSEDAFRCYSDPECYLLDKDCRSLLIFLENAGMITAEEREVIVDQVFDSNIDEPLNMTHLKLIILSNIAQRAEIGMELAWLEHLFFADMSEYTVH